MSPSESHRGISAQEACGGGTEVAGEAVGAGGNYAWSQTCSQFLVVSVDYWGSRGSGKLQSRTPKSTMMALGEAGDCWTSDLDLIRFSASSSKAWALLVMHEPKSCTLYHYGMLQITRNLGLTVVCCHLHSELGFQSLLTWSRRAIEGRVLSTDDKSELSPGVPW